MNLSEISIRNPVFAWMLMGALIIFGGIAFSRMGVSQLPDVDFPVVNVNLTLEGAAPEVMEVDVVDPIEDAIMGVQGITSVSSSSRMGGANVTIEFELNKNIDIAVQEIQNVISRATRVLPKNLDPPVVTKTNPEDQPIIWLTVSSKEMERKELMSLVRDQVKNQFSTVPGVGEVSLGGYVDRNLRVWVSGKKLDDYDLTVTDVINTIQLEHSEKPSGRIETADREYNIRTMGEAPTPEQFGKIVINRRGGAANYRPITLDQVAQVEDGLADVRRKSRVMGAPAIGLGIRKQRGANAVEVAKAVKERLEHVQSILPKGVEAGVRFDTTRFIEESVQELNFTLILSALLTALVCWGFLGSLSATLNIILAIPTSVVGSFIVLYALGFTLNTFTLLGLSLAIGIVVDDAIMVLENIVRHREQGQARRQAALHGSREITFAAVAATAAIIAIFLPVAFMKGIIGKFFFQFGVTLSVAVLFSLLEALTLTPMRCAEFLKVGKRATFLGRGMESVFRSMAALYARIIPVLLRHRWKTLGLATLFFVLSYLMVGLLKKEFVPPQDQGLLMVRLQTPVGSSIQYTDSKITEVEAVLRSRPEIHEFFTTIGSFTGSDANTGMIMITLKPFKQRGLDPRTHKRLTQQELAQALRLQIKGIKDVKAMMHDPSLAGFSAKRGLPIEFSIRGAEWDVLIDSSQKIMEEMTKSGLMTDVDSDYLAGMPEVRVIPDRNKARQYGVSIADITETVDSSMGGTIAGKFSRGGHRYDVRVRLVEPERLSSSDITRLKVRNNRGELISLSDVVTIQEQKSLQSISRQDRQRAITVFANLAPGASQDKAIERVQKIANDTLPSGYHIAISGSAKTFQESFSSLIFALLFGIVVAYMVLASQFNSFLHPFTVLMALPFSISGAFIGLWLGGHSLNIYSMIGLILLMGIVKKNSILLVDFTNQVRREGLGPDEALVKACPIRIRPIVMTSVATVAGALPPALAIGPGAESRVPMAIAVISGVIVSTFLTLFVVPCVYSLLSRFEGKKEPL